MNVLQSLTSLLSSAKMFANDLAMDLGTANTLVYVNGKIELNQPSVVALLKKSGSYIPYAFGQQAILDSGILDFSGLDKDYVGVVIRSFRS